MRSFNIVFSVTTGASPSHTHASVISGKMLWGAARQCGIVPQDLWLGFNKWPFIRFVLPSAGGYVPTQLHWDIWEHLLSDGFSVMSPRFLCISFQPWLARSWQDSADGMLLSGTAGGGMVGEVPVSGCDLWQRAFYSRICLSTGWFLLQLSMRWGNTAKTQRKGYCVATRVKGKRSSKATRTFLRQHTTGLHRIFSENLGARPDVSLSAWLSQAQKLCSLIYLLNAI